MSSENAARVRRWAETLDTLDYYALFRLQRPKVGEPGPSEIVVREAFAMFAAAFHPDRYAKEDEATREMATRIFRRGNEAVRVLTNPVLRDRYLVGLRNGVLRMSGDDIARASSSHIKVAPVADPASGSFKAATSQSRLSSVEAIVTSQAALPFAKQADVFLARGDYKQAVLQLELACSKEPTNTELANRLAAAKEQKKMRASSGG